MDRDVAGQQVLRDGAWHGVPPLGDGCGLLVNIGVSLEVISNGIFRSPVHRAVTNSEQERISLVMFYTADPEKEIEPMAGILDEKQPARYKRVKCRDLLAAHREYFARRGRVVESLKILVVK
uniref:Isopenicillin N synthase-like Fe(2+) 2OG dioxygenase domain-containing protein n=1 Tax=Setaria viridis TaxID=4556 RepID=A0A4U6UTZ0_SETVI|nr:hypothetical protein SEVIR_4G051702v2 [Setaria viridis]